MPRSRLLALTFSICLMGNAVSASAQVRPPEAAPAQPAGEDLPAGLIPPPLPQQPLAAELTPLRRFCGGICAAPLHRWPSARCREGRSRRPQAVLCGAPERAGLGHADRFQPRRHGRASRRSPAPTTWGLDASAFRLPALAQGAELTREQRAEAEIALSLAILEYARHARGGRADPLSLSRNLDRKPQLLDPRSVIEAAASTDSPDAYLRALHPQHPQFERLRQAYLSLKRSDPPLVEQVVQTKAKGKSKKKRTVAKAPAGSNLRTLLVNMEQWRWMPEDLGSFYVWVNIPEYTVRVVKAERVIHSERVVVGRASTQTPVFSHQMEQVIFHPVLGRAGLHQDQRAAAEPRARQHRRARAPEPARLLSRPRHQSGQRRLDQGGHAQVPRLPAARQRQRAGHREIPLSQQARRLHARHAEQEPVQCRPRARSVTAACGCATR